MARMRRPKPFSVMTVGSVSLAVSGDGVDDAYYFVTLDGSTIPLR